MLNGQLTLFLSCSEKFKEQVAIPLREGLKTLGIPGAIIVSDEPLPPNVPSDPDSKITEYMLRSDAFVALCTPDDELVDGTMQCRPNIIDELRSAMSMAHLASRICVFKEQSVELPSNINPTYLKLDMTESIGNAELLIKQLERWGLLPSTALLNPELRRLPDDVGEDQEDSPIALEVPFYSFSTDMVRDFLVMRASGEQDIYSAPKAKNIMRSDISRALKKRPKGFILDLTEVTYVDSTFLGVIRSVMGTLYRHDAFLAVACEDDNILRIFDITGFSAGMPIAASAEELMESGAASEISQHRRRALAVFLYGGESVDALRKSHSTEEDGVREQMWLVLSRIHSNIRENGGTDMVAMAAIVDDLRDKYGMHIDATTDGKLSVMKAAMRACAEERQEAEQSRLRAEVLVEIMELRASLRDEGGVSLP